MSHSIPHHIFILLFTTLLLFGCADDEPTPLHVGAHVWLGYEPLFLARSLNHFKDEEIRLVEFVSASETIRAFSNQSIDAAALTLDEALLLLNHGIDITVVLVQDISNGADVILSKPDITAMSSLAGKRVGVEGNAVGAYALARALELHQLSLKDIKIIQFEINEHEKAYKEDRIDAVVTYEPMRTKLLNRGAKELFSSREIPNEIVDVLVVRNQVLIQHAGQIQKLVNGWFKALEYLNNSPEDAAQGMTSRLKIPVSEILNSLNNLSFPSKEENIRLITGSNPELLLTAQRLEKIMLANRLLQDKVPVDRLFKTSLPWLIP